MDAIDRRRFLALGGGAAAAAALSACSSGSRASGPTTSTRPRAAKLGAGKDAPFEHVVILMMENRSFDHLLGWLPGADGRQAGLRYPDLTGALHPTWSLHDDYQGCTYMDPQHQWEAGRTQLNGGKGDGFLFTQVQDTSQQDPTDLWPIGYYPEAALPVLGTLARQYTTLDRYFAALNAGTWPNRIYLVAGTTDVDFTGLFLPDGTAVPTSALETTIWDRIADAGLSGGYYAYGEPMTKVFASRKYDAITHPVDDFFAHAKAGTLPNLTIVEPDYTSESEAAGTSNDDHPYGSIRSGEAYVARVYDAIDEGPAVGQDRARGELRRVGRVLRPRRPAPGPGRHGRRAARTAPRLRAAGVPRAVHRHVPLVAAPDRLRRSVRALLDPAHDRVAMGPRADDAARQVREEPRRGARLLPRPGTGDPARVHRARAAGVPGRHRAGLNVGAGDRG